MSSIFTKYMQNIDLKNNERITYINAVVLMGVFTFLFLGTEYLYVEVLSQMMSEDKTVLAQNYALGASAVGFLLYSFFNSVCKNKVKIIVSAIISPATILCIVLICIYSTYMAAFITGLILFLFLGLFGSGVFYVSMRMMKDDRYLARAVGVSYALGIMLQFANNNIVRSKIAEAVFLSIFLLLLVWLLIKNDLLYCKQNEQEMNITSSGQENNVASSERKMKVSADGQKNITSAVGQERGEDTGKIRQRAIVGGLLILLVALMTCIFSTLDNAVTLVHANGTADIGQWPRILLALSGLAAGFVFDIQNRKYMGLVMYCVMVLSTICIVVLKFSEPFLIGLVVFYLSAGFFAVFFVTGFMEISRHMRIPDLWAGMGRAVNNITAAVIAGFVLNLLSSGSNAAIIILGLILFVAVSALAAIYTFQKRIFFEQLITDDAEETSEKDKMSNFSEMFSFTEREAEVFSRLINTEDSVQTIAENMYVSRRTLERYISSIYEKTGVKSRIGLLKLYNK